MKKSLLFLINLLLSCCIAHGDTLKTELNKAREKSVTGDITAVLSFFDKVENIEQSEIADLYQKYKSRFIDNTEQVEFDEPFIQSLYECYTTYWHSSLRKPKTRSKAEKLLIKNLARITKDHGRKTTWQEGIFGPNKNRLEEFCIATAKDKGYYILMGRTAPLLELMIWQKQHKETYTVKLPSETFPAEVVFMEQFLLKGWLGYATFGRSHTGGWHRDGIIYRVGGKPDEIDETFNVSILAHEGRHVSDTFRYKNMNERVLEYRAKLTELLLAEESFFDRLIHFKTSAASNKSAPHAYANFLLTNNLINLLTDSNNKKPPANFQFEDYPIQTLKDAIDTLLEENTKTLK